MVISPGAIATEQEHALVKRGRVQVAGEVDDLLASHRLLTGPAAEAGIHAERLRVVHARGVQARRA